MIVTLQQVQSLQDQQQQHCMLMHNTNTIKNT
jgi:hypothetical protein